MNKPNPSTTGHYPAPFSTEYTTAGTTAPTYSGPTGMDQSVTMGSCSETCGPSNAGNVLPGVPPLKRS
jgi:hypothetical protein